MSDLDSSARMWFAGPAGLSCYDGCRVRTFDRRNGLECAGLRALAIDASNTFWIGTDLGLEVLELNETRMKKRYRLPWAYGLVTRISISPGSIWLGTSQGIVQLLEDRNAGALRIGFHEDVGFVNDLEQLDPTCRLVASAHLGLAAIEGSLIRRVRNPELGAAGKISCVKAGVDGNILAGSENGLWFLDHLEKTVGWFKPADGSPEVTAIAVDGNRAWVGFGKRLYSYDTNGPGNFVLDEYDRLESRINHIKVDAIGNVWVATNSSGAVRFSCLRGAIEFVETCSAGAIYSIKAGPAGALRIGGDGFLSSVSVGADRKVASRLLAEISTTIWDTVADPSGGKVWLATQTGLLQADADGEIRDFKEDAIMAAPCRVLILRGRDLWVGTLRGLICVHAGGAKEIKANDGQSLGYVYTMRIDADSRLWVGTLGRGLWRETIRGMEPFVGGPLSATGNTYVVLASPADTRVLVIQDERIILIDEQLRPRLLAEGHPIGGWVALWLDEDRVAVGSSDGLYLLNVGTGLVEQRINAILGANAWEFMNNRTLAWGLDSRLYCGINAGLIAIDFDLLSRFSRPPTPELDAVAWRDASPENAAGVYSVSSGKWSVNTTVYTGWLVDEDRVRFRFQLVGFESAWSALNPAAEVRYSSLPAGEYALQAQAFSPFTGFGAVTVLWRLRVKGNWWEPVLAVPLRVFSRIYQFAVRNRALIERNRRIEQNVSERTDALNKSNELLKRSRDAFEINAKTDALTGVGNRRKFEDTLLQEINRASRSGAPIGLLMVDIDHFKKFNDRYGHQAGDECLRAVAHAMNTGIRISDLLSRYGGEEFVMILPGADVRTVEEMGKRICQKVAKLSFPHVDGLGGIVTISAGGTSARALNATELIRMADMALYAAKNKGRNCFAMHLPPPVPINMD